MATLDITEMKLISNLINVRHRRGTVRSRCIESGNNNNNKKQSTLLVSISKPVMPTTNCLSNPTTANKCVCASTCVGMGVCMAV